MEKWDNDIIELYEAGYSPSEITNKLGCSIGTIYNALKRNKKETRNHCWGISPEIREEVIRRYRNNESVFFISKETGINQPKIQRILSEGNIEKISASKRLNPNLVEDYFRNIDTEDKAYWLGWLLTDGCIERTSISISLQARDKEILDLFESDLGLSNKIKVFNKEYYRFYFNSKRMTEDLKQYGIIPNKTFSVSFPNISENLYPAFLRGCLDGDGSLLILNSRGKEELELSFTGNKQCVESFNIIISRLAGIEPKNITNNHSIFRVRWSNREEIVKMCNILYNNCGEHRLARKYEKFLKIKEAYEVC